MGIQGQSGLGGNPSWNDQRSSGFLGSVYAMEAAQEKQRVNDLYLRIERMDSKINKLSMDMISIIDLVVEKGRP